MVVLTEDMKRVIRDFGPAFVATVCPDGTPNLSPKGTTTVWDDSHLIFANIASPVTMANLEANPAVEINVVDPVRRTGYRFKGVAAVHADGAAYTDGRQFFARERGMDPNRIRGVAIIEVTHARPIVSPAYGQGATEAEVVEQFASRWEQVYGWKIDREKPVYGT